MQFNASKCSVMHIGKSNKIATYTMNKQPLQVTKKEKDLGVWITDTLKPGEHCSIVANKANRMLGLIWRNIAFKDKSTICKLYKSLVRPHLDYCIQAWKPYLKKDINTIRVWFLPEETSFFQTSGRNWKKLVSSSFFRKKVEETGRNRKKLEET